MDHQLTSKEAEKKLRLIVALDRFIISLKAHGADEDDIVAELQDAISALNYPYRITSD